jgi:hypothetical protein
LQIKRSLIRRQQNSLQSTSPKKLPPKIISLDVAPRIPLSPNPIDHGRRLARIEQIKQLYTPREFKRLHDQQMQLVLPESPLKTVRGQLNLGILLWIYASLLVFLDNVNGVIMVGFFNAVFRVFVYEENACGRSLGFLEELARLDALWITT